MIKPSTLYIQAEKQLKQAKRLVAIMLRDVDDELLLRDTRFLRDDFVHSLAHVGLLSELLRRLEVAELEQAD